MSQLPEWLWPVEDEEAVQEAERLIEETHNTLRKMEADMQIQRTLSEHVSSKTEKLKSSMNDKIYSLERELKNFSEPVEVTPTCEPQPNLNKLISNKCVCANDQKTSSLKVPPEFKAKSASQQLPLPLNRKHKNNSKAAEQVVMSAREKVQEALDMARHVSASLDQRVSTTICPSKPLTASQVTNVGIFEVKSQADETKTQTTKPRLQQALLPSISIKRGLEKQSILSIQVPPGEKTVTPNVSVYNVQHDKGTIPQEDLTNKKATSNNHEENKNKQGLEKTVAQLSKQLMEVEELREINQTQVNHVLKYLLSRVCSSSQPQKRTEPTEDELSHVKDKEMPKSPVSSSSSKSSTYPIAYDSLSRFLETYKKAAEHNMIANKRAAERKQKERIKQKKEIQQSQSTSVNHLLIGPLRQAVKLKVSDLHSSTPDYQHEKNVSNPSDRYDEKNSSSERDVSKNNVIPSEKSSSPQEEMPKDTSHNSSLASLRMPSGGISYDEYEDDWEEEDHNGLHNSDLSHLPLYAKKELLENQEHLMNPSVSNSMSSQQVAPKSLEIESMSLHLNLPDSLMAEKQNSDLADDSPVWPKETVAAEKLSKLAKPSQDTNFTVNQVMEEQTNRPDGCHVRDDHNAHLENFTQMEDNCKASAEITVNEVTDSNLLTNKNKRVGKENEDKQPTNEGKAKCSNALQKKSQTRLPSSCSSSSDAEVQNEPRRQPRSTRRWDLQLREDLQLQSAILLNWQLENRWNSNKFENDSAKDHLSKTSPKDHFITDVEKRWQKTLDELDLRVKMIEENEKINRIANEIKKQVREEQTKTVTETKFSDDWHKISSNEDKISQTESRVVTKDQTVQTSPIKPPEPQNEELLRKHTEVTAPNHSIPIVLPDFKLLSGLRGHLTTHDNEDLTSELLAYSRMGILSSNRLETKPPKSPTSTSISSQLQQSSSVVSLSDGELRSSGSESCGCSEGEFCVCGGRKPCSERAPPDGSQTLSEGENFLRDISQGEIPSNKINILKDTSFGEIASQENAGMPLEGQDLIESIDSEDFEWDLR